MTLMQLSDVHTVQLGTRVNILGVGITPLDLPSAVSNVLSFLRTGDRGYVCVTGMHGIMEAQRDSEFRKILNNSFLTTPDGIPTVWIGHLDGHYHMKQVRGADLMLHICHASVKSGTRHFLYGGKPGVANLLRNVLELRFPGINIVGTYSPPFRSLTPEEESQLRCHLEASKPDILWCGISTPKQERFMAHYIRSLQVKLMIGVGAAFDLNAGLLKDSPLWVQHSGLQWAHRLIQEPRRLWRRYLLNIPRFLALYALQRTRLRSFSLNGRAALLHAGGIGSTAEVNSLEQSEAGIDDIAA